jgi:hypothetical protein
LVRGFNMRHVCLPFLLLIASLQTGCIRQNEGPSRHRIIISSDIGGTDPDDNQSMIHLLMYSDKFQIEGLISSPSYGEGSKQEIYQLIDLYKQDFKLLSKKSPEFPQPSYLRSVCKQGRRGSAPFAGHGLATEGSDWIIHSAMKETEQPIWILVWGGLEDLAQALHDAPEIRSKIRVYWIGGPNKKWSANSYAYLVEHFPDLWFIEANATYRGFFSNEGSPDSMRNEKYYDNFICGNGHLGKAFQQYYGGRVKMGDTPSLLYLMHGDPSNPLGESWGGSFEKLSFSPVKLVNRSTTQKDTVAVYTIVEWRIDGPDLEIAQDSACFTLTVGTGSGKQSWPGYYLGDGKYAVRYAPKQAETIHWEIESGIEGFSKQSGQIVVINAWPGIRKPGDLPLGEHWYSDRKDASLFDGKWQGAKTTQKWRRAALQDWAERWGHLDETR